MVGSHRRQSRHSEESGMPSVRWILHLPAGLLAALTVPVAAQSDYPNRPVRLIIPFPPGGSNDVVGRMIGTQLSEQLGKQVVVDNRAGAGGVVGTEIVSKAPPDGYTLGVISLAHAVNPWLYKLRSEERRVGKECRSWAAGNT